MDVSQVTDAIRKLWDFTWPPFVVVALLIGTAWLAAPQLFERAAVKVEQSVFSRANLVGARAALRRLGLGKVTPFALAFAFLFGLFVTRTIVSSVGQLVPPSISFRPDTVIARNMNRSDLVCLIRRYPREIGLARIHELAMQQGRLRETFRKDNNWVEHSGDYHVGFITLKFLFLWSLLLGLANIRFTTSRLRAVLRLCALLLAIAVVAGMYGVMFLYAIEQEGFEDIQALRFVLAASPSCVDAFGQGPVETHDECEYLERLARDDWWHLDAALTTNARWFYRTFLVPDERPPVVPHRADCPCEKPPVVPSTAASSTSPANND